MFIPAYYFFFNLTDFACFASFGSSFLVDDQIAKTETNTRRKRYYFKGYILYFCRIRLNTQHYGLVG